MQQLDRCNKQTSAKLVVQTEGVTKTFTAFLPALQEIYEGGVVTIASFPAPPPPVLCSSVCIQHNTRKLKSGEIQRRPGNTYHMNGVWWTPSGHGGGGGGGGGMGSLIPRPSPAPVFDRLQYAKTEGEGLVNLTT